METHNTREVEEILEELWYKIAEWNTAQPEDIDRYAENVEKFITHQLQKARLDEYGKGFEDGMRASQGLHN